MDFRGGQAQSGIDGRHATGFIVGGDPLDQLGLSAPATTEEAAASLSRRSGIFFATESGPWQPKHLSDRIGRTSRLNLMIRSAPRVGDATTSKATASALIR